MTCLLDNRIPNTLQDILEKLREKNVQPAKGRWSKSNLREYLAALTFLKLAQGIRSSFYLRGEGMQLKAIATFRSERLNKEERNYFTALLFQNERFLAFLTLFTKGVPASNVEAFVSIGHRESLREEHVKAKAYRLFGYYDKREFSDKGVFLNWATSIRIVEKDLKTDEYFPVFPHEIKEDIFLSALSEEYDNAKDRKTLRAPIFEVRSRVCEKLKIPHQQFDATLANLNTEKPHIYILEKAPTASFPSIQYGLGKTKSDVYYYLRIRGK